MNSGFAEFLRATPQDRRDVFLSAAARLGTPEQNVEKDFWVTGRSTSFLMAYLLAIRDCSSRAERRSRKPTA
jgi:hypothetical protein